jgi:hypothetical protein
LRGIDEQGDRKLDFRVPELLQGRAGFFGGLYKDAIRFELSQGILEGARRAWAVVADSE